MNGLQLFFLTVGFGLILEVVFFFSVSKLIGKPFRVQKKYSFIKHSSLMSIPIWGLIALVITGYYDYVQLFLAGAFVGTLAEYCFGRFFYRIEGKKIWIYQYGTFSGYTSIFSIPYWGGATLLFVALYKILGL